MSTLSHSQQQQIGTLIRHEISALTQLLQLLDEEYTLLDGKQPDALQQLAQHKQQQLDALQQLSHRREYTMSQLGISPAEQAGLPFADGTDLQLLWQQMISLAQQCRHRNRINGSIVDTATRQTRQALEILRGAAGATPAAALYDQHGHATTTPVKRPITQV